MCLARRRQGQALVEFAIISFVMTAILAGFLALIVLGMGSMQNNLAAESAGRLLDRHEALSESNFDSQFLSDASYVDFESVNAGEVFRFLSGFVPSGSATSFYDEGRLILSPADWNQRDTLDLPPINRMLLGQFTFDPDLDAYRYPGAVVQNAAGQQTVLIPILDFVNDTTGETTLGIGRTFNVTSTDAAEAWPVAQNWVAPVTITRVSAGSGSDGAAFQIVIFVPSQPASSIDLQVVRDATGRVLSQTPVEANDAALLGQLGTLPAGYTFDTPAVAQPGTASMTRGQFGLGESFAFLTRVRPYRRVFESASVFRLQPATP